MTTHRGEATGAVDEPAQSGSADPELPRSSGILLHVTSLPAGRLGADAYAFVDWLVAAGQSWWQVLPLVPPFNGRSPYTAKSAFACWPELLAQPGAPVSATEISDFRERQTYWIAGWERFGGGPEAIADQVRFEREWNALRDYATARGVRLIGDLAIYVAPGSADQRAHPELFQKDFVAGAPPDPFSETGQLWGNPLYDWQALRREGYRWWIERLRRSLEMFDLVRIDHFRGFVAYWAVPEGDDTAMGGRWRRGPGHALFDAVWRELPMASPRPLVAEDLGVITAAVERLRDDLGLPGMLVLQFGFDPHHPRSPHRPRNHVEHRLVYTGTHDHDTIRGWYESLPAAIKRRVDAEIEYHDIAEPESWWALIRLVLSSPARVAILQAQDVLGLGGDARMNNPAHRDGNWGWQLHEGALTADLAARLRDATETSGRLATSAA